MSRADWKWYGTAGHFIGAEDCRFHMLTRVGKYLVSTIGEYFPHARRNGTGFESLGAGPELFETYVFHAGKPCDALACQGCGVPFPQDYLEIRGRRSMTQREATETHYEFCELADKGEIEDET